MTNRWSCEEVRMAAWALRDGEAAAIGRAEIDAHVAACAGCRVAVAEIERLDRDLSRVDYERLDVDLWPAIRPAIASAAQPEKRTDAWALAGLIAVVVAWRACQLLLDLPAPVVNSIVPLACVVFVLWRLAGDPFAIHVSPHQFGQERA